jgi:hypothetical protein
MTPEAKGVPGGRPRPAALPCCQRKTLKTVKSEADAAAGIIAVCYLYENANSTFSFTVMPVSPFGSLSTGFLYGTSLSATPRTALDVATSSPQAYLQEVDPMSPASAA